MEDLTSCCSPRVLVKIALTYNKSTSSEGVYLIIAPPFTFFTDILVIGAGAFPSFVPRGSAS